MVRRLALPLTVSLGAAFAAQVEGTMFTLWAADHTNGCSGSSPSEACSLSGVVAMIAGTFFAVETLAATLVALVLYRNGKRGGAAVTAAALATGLLLEHVWLVT
jgi:ABC-type spermidine/putrescine transport system permease subunit II